MCSPGITPFIGFRRGSKVTEVKRRTEASPAVSQIKSPAALGLHNAAAAVAWGMFTPAEGRGVRGGVLANNEFRGPIGVAGTRSARDLVPEPARER